ncbi:MAG: hypothetical protein ACPHIA_07825 [Alphaproteobacteria bacterium]
MSDIFVIDKLSDIRQSCSQRELASRLCASIPDNNERQLWCAVIWRAWHDFFSGVDYVGSASDYDRANMRAEARSFLFDTDHPWATARRDVCEAAGVDPDALREQALKEIWGKAWNQWNQT